MSTRALYTFRDSDGSEFHVYKHHDGYPTGAAEALTNALEFAWRFPRYEADDFAAAFIAGNKGHYYHQEMRTLRKLEALGNRAAFLGEPIDPAEVAKLVKNLVRCREYAKDYNGGGVRACPSGTFDEVAPQDLEYWYLITPVEAGHLLVTAHAVSHQGEWKWNHLKNGTIKRTRVPKAKQGWKIEEIFVAPLKTGESLKRVANTWEESRKAAA